MTYKKFFTVLAVAAFAAMIVSAPLAAAPGCPKKGDGEKMMGRGCMMLMQIANLSAEQKAKLEKLHQEHQKAMVDMRANLAKQRIDLKALLKNPADVKKAEAKIDEIARLHADMQKKCLAQRLAARALLSDEQKAQLDKMGCGMMGGMAGPMGRGGCRMGMKGAMKGCMQEQAQGKAACQQKAAEEKK